MVTTIQKTGKFWKFLFLVSMCAIFYGAVMVGLFVADLQDTESAHTVSSSMNPIDVLILMAGLGGLAFAKVGAWWCHG